ncbi:MAG: mucoidy inhibitor MuiA family protein, partial [Alphaproteobacteria bacterium]
MIRHALLILLLAGAGLTPTIAASAEVNANSHINSVTVFPDGAEVLRTFEATLEAGTNVLVLSNLPASVTPNSVRVEGKATEGVEIGSVDTKRVIVKKPGSAGLDASERKRIEDEIKRLTDESNAQDKIIQVAMIQTGMAKRLSKLPMFNNPGAQSQKDVAGANTFNAEIYKQIDWNALFDLVGTRLQQSINTMQNAKIKRRELGEKIAVLKEKLKLQPKETWSRTEIRVNIDVATAATGDFTVRYQVGNASWQPVYDARLSIKGKGDNPEITVIRRGAIAQDTGEDWENAKVTLSTMRATDATSAPDLKTLKVKFAQRFGARARASAPISMMREMAPAPAKEAPEADDTAKRKMLRGSIAIPRPAIVNATGYQATFEIPQPVSLKSGVGEKRVFISSEKQKVKLFAKAAPKKYLAAFLHAKFTYEGVAPILPGEVSLYRDDMFIGRGAFPHISKGEEKELGFGRDDAVRVSRVELKRAQSETGLISSSKVDEQRFKITVQNLHDWAVPVVVTEQVPVSEDENIVVTPHPETTKPTTTTMDDKRGVYAWNFDLKPNAKKELVIGYTVKWPAKREIYMDERL